MSYGPRKTHDALMVPCPYCGVAARYWCVTKRTRTSNGTPGTTATELHLRRVIAGMPS